LNVTKNSFDQLEVQFNNQMAAIQLDFKQNKDKVVEFLVESILNVPLELPDNIKKTTIKK
jgi:hypothetical protein